MELDEREPARGNGGGGKGVEETVREEVDEGSVRGG